MDLLQLREKAIFETLKGLGEDFVLIGGYAVNAYTLPRFSVDCDIVVRDAKVAKSIERKLSEYYAVENSDQDLPYSGSFIRLEKKLQNDFRVSMDILVAEILDRQTGATFSADWVFRNSEIRKLRGKTIAESLELRIINLDALFVMKAVSARGTDIRDVFMMAPGIKDMAWVKAEIEKRYNVNDRLDRILKTVDSRPFRDGLQGVYGQVEDKVFEKHGDAIRGLKA
jgi:hypothetical protein